MAAGRDVHNTSNMSTNIGKVETFQQDNYRGGMLVKAVISFKKIYMSLSTPITNAVCCTQSTLLLFYLKVQYARQCAAVKVYIPVKILFQIITVKLFLLLIF